MWSSFNQLFQVDDQTVSLILFPIKSRVLKHWSSDFFAQNMSPFLNIFWISWFTIFFPPLTPLWLLMALVVFEKSTHYNMIIFKVLKNLTRFEIAGPFVKFSKSIRKYSKLPTLGRLEIFGRNRDAIKSCIWLNSVGDRSLEMSRSSVWENNITLFWLFLNLWISLGEGISPTASCCSKQEESWKELAQKF